MPAFLLVGNGRPKCQRAIDKACHEHDASLTVANLPGDGWRWWVEAENMGAPFDDWRRDAVVATLHERRLAHHLGL